MSLAISNYNRFSTCGVRSSIGYSSQAGTETFRTGDQRGSTDTVQFSDGGRLSSLLGGLMLPTEENVRQLSVKLLQDLGNLLNSAGISSNPPVEFTVDSTGEIQVKGDRVDKERILQTINGNEKVKEEIRTTAAIASHAAAIAESLKFQNEYRASNNPDSIVAKYSYLFNTEQRPHQISLVYDGSGINVFSDGKAWLSSGTL